MIIKLFKKIVSYFLLAIAVFGNTGLFSSAKIKAIEKETPLQKTNFVFEEKLQCRAKEVIFDSRNSENLFIREPAPSLTYNSYHDRQSIPFGFPKPEQSTYSYVMFSTDSTAVAYPIIINIDYATNPARTLINEIRDININIVEPKSFLAKNLNEEWKKSIDFYSNSSAKQRKI